jgi:hypothetical protein
MRSLGRQEQAVLRELQQALAREDFMLARRIYEANPDLQDEIQALWQQNQRVITR